MHAIRLHAFGPAENLTHEEVEDPRPGPGTRLPVQPMRQRRHAGKGRPDASGRPFS